MLICPNCFYQNSDGVAICEACCYKLPHLMSCPGCGESCYPNAKFCGSCGYSLQVDIPLYLSMGDQIINHHLSLESSPKTKNQAEELQEIASATSPTTASLLHLQSEFRISLNMRQPVIHIGKPNQTVKPDINLSAFSHAEVVSRIHADIRIENDHYFIEDKGSCNGTFLNNMRIYPGEKKPLTPGDKITLGKGNLVSFIFELS